MGNLIEDANKYLNKEIGNAKYKKERAFSALKVFFSFLELVHIHKPTDLTNDDIKDLRLFLEGGKKVKRGVWTFKLDEIIKHLTTI